MVGPLSQLDGTRRYRMEMEYSWNDCRAQRGRLFLQLSEVTRLVGTRRTIAKVEMVMEDKWGPRRSEITRNAPADQGSVRVVVPIMHGLAPS